MSNDSATGGYLQPAASPAPLEGQSLNDFLQQIVTLITGIPGKYVRQRWQAQPANLPPVGTAWAALGITRRVTETFAYVNHNPSGQGSDELSRNQTLEMLVSFYGPQADDYAQIFADGLQIPQNREVMQQNAMGLLDTGEPIAVPTIVKDQWLYRVDLPWRVTRQIRRVYPVLSILSANGTLYTDTTPQIVVPIEVNQ